MNIEDCEGVRLSAMARMDGEEPVFDESEEAAHLAGCEECREEVERLISLSADLEGHAADPADADLWRRVRPDLARRKRWPRTKPALLLSASLLPVYRIAEAIEPAGLLSPNRLIPVVLVLLILAVLRESPFALNPALAPEGDKR